MVPFFRAAPGGSRPCDEVGNLAFSMVGESLFEFGFHPPVLKQAYQPLHVSLITDWMSAVNRFQFSLSAASCLEPLLVTA